MPEWLYSTSKSSKKASGVTNRKSDKGGAALSCFIVRFLRGPLLVRSTLAVYSGSLAMKSFISRITSAVFDVKIS
jgi:hypothetical protein